MACIADGQDPARGEAGRHDRGSKSLQLRHFAKFKVKRVNKLCLILDIDVLSHQGAENFGKLGDLRAMT